MEEASSLPATDPVNPGKIRRRKQFTVLLACVLIAIALWFLRALENEFTTRVDHPVTYINLPDRLISMNPLPQRISLEVKGLGFSVLRHNWNFSKAPLIMDISKLKSAPASRKKGFIEYLPMNQYFNEFSAQLKDLKVMAILPDTLTFRFAIIKKRNIRVVPIFQYETGLSVIPDSLIRIDPRSIAVEGPDLILDTLRTIRTLPIKISREGASFSRSLGLEEIHRLVKTTPAKVMVSIGKNN